MKHVAIDVSIPDETCCYRCLYPMEGKPTCDPRLRCRGRKKRKRARQSRLSSVTFRIMNVMTPRCHIFPAGGPGAHAYQWSARSYDPLGRRLLTIFRIATSIEIPDPACANSPLFTPGCSACR